MRRRTFLAATGAATMVGIAGCTADPVDEGNGNGNGNGDDENGNGGTTGSGQDEPDTLAVATYDSFVDAPSDSPGEWIKEEFEARHDVEFEWVVPDSPINHYIERHNAGVDIDAELYMGIKPNELVRVDENTDGDLFQPTDIGALEHGENIGEEFYFDPHERMVPAYSSYAAVVYDGRTLEAPGTFEDLLGEPFEGNFAVSNPAEGSNTGLYFLLWTIHEFGTEGEYTWLDYWNDLLDNDIRILDSWGTMYAQFDEGEIPSVFSYSNDRVYARRFENDLDKHQVSLLNDEGYANLNAMGRFAQGTDDELAHRFMEFVLEPETQAKIAELNVTGPVNTETTLPEVYREYAIEPDPENVVFFGYDELMGNLEGWISEWEREVVGSN